MHLITALLFIAPLASAQPRNVDGCDNVSFVHGSRTSMSSHSDSDDNYSVIDFVKITDERCSSATIVGKVQYTPAEDDIVSMPFGAHAVFRERTAQWDRALSVSCGSDGQLVRSYQYNRQNAGYDADAQRWFASFSPKALRWRCSAAWVDSFLDSGRPICWLAQCAG